jgi:hypothetical protein
MHAIAPPRRHDTKNAVALNIAWAAVVYGSLRTIVLLLLLPVLALLTRHAIF